jgi:hypothetical protein
MFSLADWVGDAHRAKVLEIQMSALVAEELHLYVKEALDVKCSQPRRKPSNDGKKLFPSLQCVVVNHTKWSAEDEIAIFNSVQELFEKHDLEFVYKVAKPSD